MIIITKLTKNSILEIELFNQFRISICVKSSTHLYVIDISLLSIEVYNKITERAVK